MNNETPLIWAWWGWEPWQFYHREGPLTEAESEEYDRRRKWYLRLHDPETLTKAAEFGINCIVTHFVKGFGPLQEKEEMARTARLVADAHRCGIRVFGYLQFGSIFHKTFFQDLPEAEQWIQRHEDGSPVLWCDSPERFLPCINSPDFTDYLKTQIRTGILKTGLDGLHFDNFYNRPCYCSRCRQAYRQTHGQKLPAEKLLSSGMNTTEIRTWTQWRCQQLAEKMKELRSYAQSLRPDIMTIWNPSPIRGALNQPLLRGTDFFELGSRAGFLWSESGNFPRMKQGTPIHQIHFCKTAEAVGYRTFSTTWISSEEGIGLPDSPEEIALQSAECAAWNAECGSNWLFRMEYLEQFPDGILCREWHAQIDFIRRYRKLFQGSRGRGELALFFDRSSAAENFSADYSRLLIIEQLLLQKHFSFDLIFSGQEERLQKYPLVISVTEPTTADVSVLHFSDDDLKGKVIGAYECRVIFDREAGFRNADRIRSALKERELEFTSLPETVFIERRQTADGRELLHLVNYDNRHPARNIGIRFCNPPEHLQFLSPDQGMQELAPSPSGHVELKQINTWGILVWEGKTC